jgi:hypothetical protein
MREDNGIDRDKQARTLNYMCVWNISQPVQACYYCVCFLCKPLAYMD